MALFLGFEANKSYKSAGVKLSHPWGGFRLGWITLAQGSKPAGLQTNIQCQCGSRPSINSGLRA